MCDLCRGIVIGKENGINHLDVVLELEGVGAVKVSVVGDQEDKVDNGCIISGLGIQLKEIVGLGCDE